MSIHSHSDTYSDLGIYDDSASGVSVTDEGTDSELAMISDLLSDDALRDITGTDDLGTVTKVPVTSDNIIT